MSEVVAMALSPEERTNMENMAIAMYSERVADDTKMNRAEIFDKNPDARQLYFKGVHDAIMCISTWVDDEIDPELLNMFMEKLHDQTCEDLNTGHTH